MPRRQVDPGGVLCCLEAPDRCADRAAVAGAVPAVRDQLPRRFTPAAGIHLNLDGINFLEYYQGA